MDHRLLVPVLASLAALGGCVGPAEPPRAAAPVPISRPVPPPALAAPPPTTDWRDWPITPGNWHLARNSSGIAATFGSSASPLLTLSCASDGRVRLERGGAGAGQLTVRTTSLTRALRAEDSASLPASDPLLDAIGFSRGRFVVETAGGPPLVVPAWAEILRVVEDCRR